MTNQSARIDLVIIKKWDKFYFIKCKLKQWRKLATPGRFERTFFYQMIFKRKSVITWWSEAKNISLEPMFASKEDTPITWKRDLMKRVIKTSKFEPSKLNKPFFIQVNLSNHSVYNSWYFMIFAVKRGQICLSSQKGDSTQWLVAK